MSVFAPFEEIPLEDFRRVLDVNVMGYVHGARAALPPMRERGKGVLVNVSSILAEVPQPYTHAYVMSKAAVRALAGSLRQELQLRGARGIKVCRVKPATIDTFSSSTPRTTPGARPGPCHRSIPPSAWPGRSSTSSGLPRCEVIVGPIGRNLFMQWKLAPGLTERQMAVQVDKLHLLRAQAAPPTAGNLFDPAPGPGSVDGGWHGRRRTAFRRAASAALVGAGVVAAARQRR